MKDFYRLLERQNFKDADEIQAFIEAYNAGKISNVIELTNEEKAQDLVEEAYRLTPSKAKKNVEKALQLAPDCVGAYEYLASRETSPQKALEKFDKGIAIGWKKFGGKFLEENKGHFWGIHETRPFMRCLYQKANILLIYGKMEDSVDIMKEMLELNPNDNQGVRYLLLSALAMLGETDDFKKYDKMFADEESTQMLYPRALFAFKAEGNSANARKKMLKAIKANPFVVDILLDTNYKFTGSGSYTWGSPGEAEIYLMYGIFSWYKTEGALEWLVETINDFYEKETKKAATKRTAK